METFPFYSQLFLMTGLCFERWVAVCRPMDVKKILSRRNKSVLYMVVAFCSLSFPAFVSMDYLLNKQLVRYL